MASVVLCYAPGDEAFARWLAEYLEGNLTLTVSCGDAVVGAAGDLCAAVERALSGDIALVLLSANSVPEKWQRSVWETLFLERPKELGSLLGFVLLAECKYPTLLKRERFFDASIDRLQAARAIKRWLLKPEQAGSSTAAAPSDFDGLRTAVADWPGCARDVDAARALRFAAESIDDFEAVHVFDCCGRSRAGIVGDIGSRLGLCMSGRVEQNREVLAQWCATRRVLFVLAGVSEADVEFIALGGKASVIFTQPGGEFPAWTRNGSGNAVRAFEVALAAGDTKTLSLGWAAVSVLKAQERHAEVLEILHAMAAFAKARGLTQDTAKIARERYWTSELLDDESPAPDVASPTVVREQMRLPFGN